MRGEKKCLGRQRGCNSTLVALKKSNGARVAPLVSGAAPGLGFPSLGSDWAGWGFRGETDPVLFAFSLANPLSPVDYWARTYNVFQANGLPSSQLMGTPVFYPSPLEMLTPTIEKNLQNQ